LISKGFFLVVFAAHQTANHLGPSKKVIE
jgi:hypothetical protein